jgi:hypothetical protein
MEGVHGEDQASVLGYGWAFAWAWERSDGDVCVCVCLFLLFWITSMIPATGMRWTTMLLLLLLWFLTFSGEM